MSRKFAYVGSYTTEKRGGLGHGGISVFRKDADAPWKAIQTYEMMNPAFLAFGKDRRYLYSVQADGKLISAFAIGEDGALTLINQKNTGYVNGVYCEPTPDYRYLIVSSCSLITKCGSMVVFELNEDGSIGKLCSITIPEGTCGPLARHQEGVKPHQALFDNDGKYLVEVDKALDQVNSYLVDDEGCLELKHTLQWRAGSCTRHIAFHPNGKLAYIITEWTNTIVACRYHDGELTPFGVYSTLPSDYVGIKTSGAEVAVHPSGRWLYASNRVHCSIVRFEINGDGTLSSPQWMTEGNKKTRYFMIDPEGKTLYCANERLHNVTIFSIDQENGSLTLTEDVLPASAPACVILLDQDDDQTV